VNSAGLVSRFINRPAAAPIARVMRATPLAPAQVIGAGFLAAIAAAVMLGAGWHVAAAIVIQVVNILDSVDDELARLRGGATRLGEVLDAVAGRAVESLVIAGLAVHAVRFEDHPRPEFLGALTLGAVLIVAYSRARIEADLPDVAANPGLDGVFRFAGRDAVLLVAAIGALVGQCYWALAAITALSAVTIAWRLLYLRVTVGARRLPPA
jgi:phosphatidylglycerophosphate synthase